jgi:hypothetical protein
VMSCAIWLYVASELPGPATLATKGEEPLQRFSVAHIFEQAEQVRRQHDVAARREVRRLARQFR